MSSIDTGWAVCEEGLNLEEAGEVFTAMVIAMRSHDPKRIQKAVEVGLFSDECSKGLISAMGWLPEDIVNPWTQRFLNGKDMSHKLLGLATCSIRRQAPGGPRQGRRRRLRSEHGQVVDDGPAEEAHGRLSAAPRRLRLHGGVPDLRRLPGRGRAVHLRRNE